MFWNWEIFLLETNRWCQGKESSFRPLSVYSIKEMLGCTYKELMQEPYELIVQHIQIRKRIDHYQNKEK